MNAETSQSGASQQAPLPLSQYAHRQLIGLLGFILPIVVWFGNERMTAERPVTTDRGSISAFYYTGAGDFFVGVVFALALFLLTYRGYSGDKKKPLRERDDWHDHALGIIGGLAALGVALFPMTMHSANRSVAPRNPEWVNIAHYASAGTLFTVFAIFSFFIFTRSHRKEDGSKTKRHERESGKRRRDDFHRACGVLIVVGMIASVLIGRFTDYSIFLPETLVLWSFAVSWLAKGEVMRTFSRIRGGVGG